MRGPRLPEQHLEVGWSPSPPFSILIPHQEGWKQYRGKGGDSWHLKDALDLASYLGSIHGRAIVVKFHSESWAGILDGSLRPKHNNPDIFGFFESEEYLRSSKVVGIDSRGDKE